LVGDILKEIAQQAGAAGFVIYGAIRDVDAYRADDFPCYALGVALVVRINLVQGKSMST